MICLISDRRALLLFFETNAHEYSLILTNSYYLLSSFRSLAKDVKSDKRNGIYGKKSKKSGNFLLVSRFFSTFAAKCAQGVLYPCQKKKWKRINIIARNFHNMEERKRI